MTRSSQTPAVTIGMPVFDNAETVARAIKSVQEQTFRDWRLIISDDQSSDETMSRARAAAGSDPRIEIHRNEKRQVYRNFAVALEDARTPYFVWLAGDDYWHADFLARTVAALEAAPSAVSAVPEAAFIGAEERPIPNLGFLRGEAAERVRRYLAHPGGTRMYGLMRTEAARAAFPSRPVHAYDWYLMVALLAAGPQLSVPETLLFREETGWVFYARSDAMPEGSRLHRFPVLQTSLMLIRDLKIPLGALSALLALNFRKHEEYLAVNQPETYLKRRSVFRRLGAPIAKDAGKLAELAELHRGGGQPAPVVDAFDTAAAIVKSGRHAARAKSPATTTAIVTCRNAASTLPAWLDHAAGLGCEVILIDHGSTDETRGIAEAKQVAEIIDMPFEGYFDLTAQLETKQKVMARVKSDWVLHADADEFLLLPEGEALKDLTTAAEKDGKLAFACDEKLFLPRFEDECHDAEHFLTTMTNSVDMKEHDEKQRLFHRSAPLDLWFATGGHSVVRRNALIAEPRLTLAHYLGLSLDDLRGQYLSRVFAPRDTFKLWHGNRAASTSLDIVEPAFMPDNSGPVMHMPVFAPAKPDPETAEVADLVVLVASEEDGQQIRAAISRAVPGLRCHVTTSPWSVAGTLPVLNVVAHPARLHGKDVSQSVERRRASDWTRRIAAARQTALDRGTPYAEVRLEDVEAGGAQLVSRLRGLFLGRVFTGIDGFFAPGAVALDAAPFEPPVRTITGTLAADFGYR